MRIDNDCEPGERAISQRLVAKRREAKPTCAQGWSVDQPGATQRPFVIGVTGGMASGKSSIARMISGRGIIHIDADRLVHQLMQGDREMGAEIARAFPQIVTPSNDGVHLKASGKKDGPRHEDGVTTTIDRAKLAQHITQHPEALATLEAIIHPRVRGQELAIIAAARRNRLKAVVLDIPLLFETDAQVLCDVVIVAHAPLHHRRRRAFSRLGMNEEKWRRLLDRQLSDHARNYLADVVISTAIGKAATYRRVQHLMKQWNLR